LANKIALRVANSEKRKASMMVTIEIYKEWYKDQVTKLILDIQQNEFRIPVTIHDQPDLLNIQDFYSKGKGNFWVAADGENVVGTIGLIDIDNGQSALRKMFVHKDYRGKEKRVGQLLLDNVVIWCRKKEINEIYLGTIDILVAAQQFYLKNGFVEVEKKSLPVNFPVMRVDNRFFKLWISENDNTKSAYHDPHSNRQRR